MPFRITTSSANGPQFNQFQWGVVVHRVIATPFPTPDLANPLVQDALADYITVYMADQNGQIDLTTNGVGSFRVYDFGQSPPASPTSARWTCRASSAPFCSRA